jgi:hypothetical protein
MTFLPQKGLHTFYYIAEKSHCFRAVPLFTWLGRVFTDGVIPEITYTVATLSLLSGVWPGFGERALLRLLNLHPPNDLKDIYSMKKRSRGISPFAGQCEANPSDFRRLPRIFLPLVTAVWLLVFCVSVASAQSGGELTGTISDPSGAVIPNANVTATSVETGKQHTTVSNGSGVYDFPSLDVGDYNLVVSATGFEGYKQNGIVVNVAQTLKVDIRLVLGANSQTVTVQANALQVQSETNEVSTLITGQQISQLATNGRNVTALTTLGTGVSSNLPSFNGVTAQGSDANISFNGLRPDHNNWLIDGGEVYDRGSGGKLDVMPSPDVLGQFQVLSSNYAPDYGISSGGTVTMELKSGTRSFHGGLWEFVRNDALDAGYYFYKQANTPTPELRLNIFGGDIGGPIWIPHVYNESKQRTFFFVAEEWRRYIAGANASVQNTVPLNDFPTSGAALAYTPFNNGAAPIVPMTADPAKLAVYAADGLTPGKAFPGNVIPANLLDPNAVLMMGSGAIPHPNIGTDQFISSPKQPTYVREDTVRGDHNITDKLHLMGSYIHDSMQQVIYPPLWSSTTYTTVGNTFDNPSWAAVIKLSQTISPTMLNEICFCVNGNTIDTTPQGIYAEPAGWTATSFFPGANALARMPQVAFQGGPITTTWGTNYWPWKNSYLNYQIRDDFSWTRGKHSMKFGFSYMRADKNQQLQADTQGDYTFSNAQASGDAYVNFLLGFASTYQQLQDQRTDHWLNNTYSGYAMDNWRIQPKLTLNIGIRYDALPHVYEKNNQVGNFVPTLFNPADAQSPNPADGSLNPTGPGFSSPFGTPFYLNGIGLAGVGFPRSLVKNDFGTWQPRVGFAYDLNGDGKTVIRGGFGLFFERVQGNDIYDLDTTPPFAYQPSANQVYFTNPSTSYQSGATAALPTGPANLSALSYYYPAPATYQFSFGVQRELAPSVVFAMQYVGSTSTHQDDRVEQNDLPLADVGDREAVALGGIGALSGNANFYRPYQGFGNILQSQNSVNGSYHSLQTALRMQERHGLSLQVAYTWSHAIDVQSNDLDIASNPYNLNYDRGSSLYDRRNIFNVNYVYNLPFFLHSGNFAERTFLGGWQIAGVTTAQSGLPLQVKYNGPDTLGLGGNTTNYPDVVSHVGYPKKQLEWFTTTSFAAPAAPWTPAGAGGTGFGNGNKDAAVGPGLFNWNISLYKDIPIHEAIHMQFRAESFNTFNHTEFNGVDTGTNDGNFGQVTNTYDPRELQLGLKFLF